METHMSPDNIMMYKINTNVSIRFTIVKLFKKKSSLANETKKFK